MKKSNSNLLKFDIKVQNKVLWKEANFYFNQKVLDFFSSVISSTIKKNKCNKKITNLSFLIRNLIFKNPTLSIMLIYI